MRLQAAIDRVTVERAAEIIGQINGRADIIEIGTSLIKDYGLDSSVKVLKEQYPDQCFLVDIKTCDEGEYEFRKAYEAGGDIPTVMGFSSISTLKACQKVAKEFQKEYMIDLLEVPDDKLEILKKEFPEAIFCVHLPSDNQGVGLEALVKNRCEKLAGIDKIAVAGGVKLENIPLLTQRGIDTVIVGGAISKSENIEKAAQAFAQKIRGMKEW